MRGRSPLGNPLLWIVAAFVLPEVVKKCKPFAKVVGDTLVNAGEVFRKAAEEAPKPNPASGSATSEPTPSEPATKAEMPKADDTAEPAAE